MSAVTREFTRVCVRHGAELLLPSGVIIRGEVDDCSLSGMFLTTASSAPVGSTCHVTIRLGGSELVIEAEGEVARVAVHGVAVKFTSLTVDAHEHLRNLVLLNAPDPAAAEAELRQHIGLQPRV
jgi:hypothetical protein